MTKLLTLTAIIAIGSWIGVEAYVLAAYLADSLRDLAGLLQAIV